MTDLRVIDWWVTTSLTDRLDRLSATLNWLTECHWLMSDYLTVWQTWPTECHIKLIDWVSLTDDRLDRLNASLTDWLGVINQLTAICYIWESAVFALCQVGQANWWEDKRERKWGRKSCWEEASVMSLPVKKHSVEPFACWKSGRI